MEDFMKGIIKPFREYEQKGMRCNIKQFIIEYEVCQRHKSESLSPKGLLQALPMLEKIWEDISMDFTKGLPNSKGKTTIFVVVFWLSKYGHFIVINQL